MPCRTCPRRDDCTALCPAAENLLATETHGQRELPLAPDRLARLAERQAQNAIENPLIPRSDYVPWTPVNGDSRGDHWATLSAALRHLTQRQRELVCLVYRDAKSVPEAAHTLGSTPAAAGLRLRNALARLRKTCAAPPPP